MNKKKKNLTTDIVCGATVDKEEEDTKNMTIRYYGSIYKYEAPPKDCRRAKYNRKKAKSMDSINE